MRIFIKGTAECLMSDGTRTNTYVLYSTVYVKIIFLYRARICPRKSNEEIRNWTIQNWAKGLLFFV
jgi:hypothetical protein